MKRPKTQFEQLAPPLPKQHGNARFANLQVLNATLYVPKYGSKWRKLPERFGNWQTIYKRVGRYLKSNVLDFVFPHSKNSMLYSSVSLSSCVSPMYFFSINTS